MKTTRTPSLQKETRPTGEIHNFLRLSSEFLVKVEAGRGYFGVTLVRRLGEGAAGWHPGWVWGELAREGRR